MYADIIIDIVHEAVDRVFLYRVPDELVKEAAVGQTVLVPFGKGNRVRQGYIVALKEEPDYEPEKIKDLIRICPNELEAQERLISLGLWMK